MTALFIFRRDLRLQDNTALHEAISKEKEIVPVFIFTPEQLEKNPFKSNNCVQFMISCLELLDKNLKKEGSRLFYFYGDVIECLEDILKELDINSIYLNQDYTPYSIKRDERIENFCKKNKIDFNSYEDVLLHPISSIKSADGNIFQKFTPYFNKASKIKVDKPIEYDIKNLVKKNFELKSEFKENIHQFYKKNNDIAFLADENILDGLKSFKDYNKNRNELTYETTHLSAYIKFGQVSIREVYQEFSKIGSGGSDLIKQLYWRDFYYNLAYEYDYIFDKKGNLKKKYDNIDWEDNDEYFKKWCKGETGFPVVDAAMRQLNTTGYMHNRGRLITSVFLIKVLLNNWKRGEKYFAQHLIDYDPSVNTGNWGWSSGSGADSQPYYRIFNPWDQSKKHDPDCEYIKYWIPELKNVDIDDIHNWDKYYKDYPDVQYPEPIVDYKKQKSKAINMYKKIFA